MTNDRILFNTEMVEAILAGRKTQTRRVVKLPRWSTGSWDDFELDESGTPFVICENTGCLAEIKAPYDVSNPLLVCETWRVNVQYNNIAPGKLPEDVLVQYKAGLNSTGNVGDCGKWRQSIFMPRWASRITLRASEVRVARIRDISTADIWAEGVEELGNGVTRLFIQLWDSLNAKRGYSWVANPRVWVYKFELVRVR